MKAPLPSYAAEKQMCVQHVVSMLYVFTANLIRNARGRAALEQVPGDLLLVQPARPGHGRAAVLRPEHVSGQRVRGRVKECREVQGSAWEVHC